MTEPEQRTDPSTRDRIADLEAGYAEARVRLDLAIRGMILGLAVMALVTTAALVWTASVDREQDSSRRDALFQICEAQNAQNRAIHRFIAVRAPDGLARARRDFTLVEDCRGYAAALTDAGRD